MSAYAELIAGRHGDPFSILGPHRAGERTVIRTFQPGARRVVVVATEIDEELGPLKQVDPAGLFEGEMALHGFHGKRLAEQAEHA